MLLSTRASILGLLCCLISLAAVAQQTVIKGLVRSGQGPLRYATVQIKGTSIAAYTDKDGKYSIETDRKGSLVLIATLMGYALQTRTVAALLIGH
ncbi:carboxypeptidase-like regulatory domain-containing protein [Chitinophaga sp. HK235]|uniref:carboxypeptidase-like regulatory domain-containing protein n=1 Tax=Chitinophaga sp. HK235 TaxID=2952571 RepID=UPI001BA82EBD|nr:carboxypeptidase-like regulatory domain-containing protein [Chitinophaga sp. HK235]